MLFMKKVKNMNTDNIRYKNLKLRIILQDQLVPESIPDDVSDVTRQSSTTTYVMSCLDPQPYSMRLTPAPHFLSPEFNDFKPIVPKLGELVHAEQVCEKYSPPEHASSSDAPNDNTQAKKDDNNTLDGTSMDKNLSNNYDINDDDFMLMDSVANSHFTVKAPTDKCESTAIISILIPTGNNTIKVLISIRACVRACV